MKHRSRTLTAILAAALLCFSGCFAELPMDTFDGGIAASKSGFTKTGYSDSTIKAEVYSYRTVLEYEGKKLNTCFDVAEIWISSPSQLRTALAGDIRNPRESYMVKLADRVNAIVAVNGDYYPQRSGGLAVRQGQAIRAQDRSEYDLLIIDYNGDFHILTGPDKEPGLKALAGNIYQAFCFGPALIIDGEIGPDVMDSSYGGFKLHKHNPRTAIGQIGELHYVVVIAEGRNGTTNGVNGQELADYMLSLGCTQAYNLDGGNSSMLYFGDSIYNKLPDGQQRKLFDILYFASAEGTD